MLIDEREERAIIQGNPMFPYKCFYLLYVQIYDMPKGSRSVFLKVTGSLRLFAERLKVTINVTAVEEDL